MTFRKTSNFQPDIQCLPRVRVAILLIVIDNSEIFCVINPQELGRAQNYYNVD